MSWQLCDIGVLGLILKVSSLFSNAIAVVEYPFTPILAVIVLKEKVTKYKSNISVAGYLGNFVIYLLKLSRRFEKKRRLYMLTRSHSSLPLVITN